MSTLVKIVRDGRSLRRHVATESNAPVCGGGRMGKAVIAWQQDIGDPNCERCQAIVKQREFNQQKERDNMNTMGDIEKQTKLVSDARGELRGIVEELNAEVERAKLKREGRIKTAVEALAQAHRGLLAMINAARSLFDKPRTQAFHGIVVGLRKGKGGITWQNEDRVVELIKKHFPDKAAVLIRTKEEPNKKALESLDVVDLKKIGCSIKNAGDRIVIEVEETETEKAVDALLATAVKEAA